jgi:hypothetical protein
MKKGMAEVAVAVVFLAAGLASALAGEVVLFSAMAAGPDAWIWEGAKLTARDGKLTFARDKGEQSDVYLGDRFAYVPGAQIKIDVDAVTAGSYSVQVLAFNGDSFLEALDLVKDGSESGGKLYKLPDLAIPNGTDKITLKLWISKKPGSAVVFNDVSCMVPVTDEDFAYDKAIDATTMATTDGADWTAGADGGVLALRTNTPVGSVVLPDRIARPEKGILVLGASAVKKGTLTVQLCTFDADGNYLGAVDVIKKAATGVSTLLEGVSWPEGTATFQVKLWIGGLPGASATISRVTILKM